MGPNKPPPWLLEVAERPDSDAVFLAFDPAARPGLVGKVRVVVAPDTTWTTGRNALYQEGMRIQQLQGWRHEYFIFTDGDTDFRPGDLDIFHRRISAMQPAMAALGTRNACSPFPCSADVDAIVNAFHATAAPVYLPYDAAFDKRSWWASQQILISELLMSAQDYVVEFHDIHFMTNNTHTDYPRGLLAEELVEHLASTRSSCMRNQLQIPSVKQAVLNSGHNLNCHVCTLTSACLNNTFCEGALKMDQPPVDYGKLISCKPF